MSGIGDPRLVSVVMPEYDATAWLARSVGSARAQRLASYLVRDGSVSANNLRAAGWQWRIYRDIEGIGWLRSARLMLHYGWHALWKRAG